MSSGLVYSSQYLDKEGKQTTHQEESYNHSILEHLEQKLRSELAIRSSFVPRFITAL